MMWYLNACLFVRGAYNDLTSGYMDIFGWLSRNGELKLIINGLYKIV